MADVYGPSMQKAPALEALAKVEPLLGSSPTSEGTLEKQFGAALRKELERAMGESPAETDIGNREELIPD